MRSVKEQYVRSKLQKLLVWNIARNQKYFHLLIINKGKRYYCKCLIILQRIRMVSINETIIQSFFFFFVKKK